jgi:hypothetical protein
MMLMPMRIAKVVKCEHKRLISTKNRVIDKVYHIQTVNGAIAHFKDWTERRMRSIATKYLPHYLAWFKETRANLDKSKYWQLHISTNINMEQSQINIG